MVVLRFLLGGASRIYSIVIGLRNFLYSKNRLKIHRVNATVFSVGNMTVGGTGKTPLVIWLCNQITKNHRCAILTRGYKTRGDTQEDEPAILRKHCTQAKVIVNPNRVAGADEAISQFDAKVLIADDGFQHRRLGRDMDIVTIDAGRPFGYGRMLPAGLLREPVTALKRADAVVITRCDQTAEAELTQLEEKLRSINQALVIARSVHEPVCVKSQSGEAFGSDWLKGKRIFAFCGIGNPDAFFNTIKKLGAELLGSRVYNDHYHYTDKDIDDIYEQACAAAEHQKADLILTTEKDWTKIAAGNNAERITQYEIPFAYLVIELKFTAGEDKLRQLIEETLAGKMRKK